MTVSEIEGRLLPITPAIASSDSVLAFISPYQEHVNAVLDSSLSYAPYPITKTEGKWNSPAGNLLADIILSETSPLFKARTGKDLDFVLLNHGGIRSIISQGKVSARTAFEVMPFENSIVVVALSGKAVRQLLAFLVEGGRPHPLAGIKIVLDKEGELQFVNIKGSPFNENRTYYVATSSYLVDGGDDMYFFREGLSFTETDYLIRNAMIDYFKKTDTLHARVDDRFVQLK